MISDDHRPMYEFDADARGAGEVVSQVARKPQIEALEAVAGDGPVEPDGWVRDYNDVAVPVLDGVPVLLLGGRTVVDASTEGAERSTWHEVDGYEVRVDLAGAHPENTSKLTVEMEDDDA